MHLAGCLRLFWYSKKKRMISLLFREEPLTIETMELPSTRGASKNNVCLVYPALRDEWGRTLPRLSSCRRTTRAGHHLVVSLTSETHSGVLVLMEAKPFASSGPPCFTQCARQDSNLQPFGSKPNALSFELRAHNYLFVVF